jgi:2-polyprenyl-3-methyl-5-hydroxy-6-metoxy-1,4-benzoquinol methylase
MRPRLEYAPELLDEPHHERAELEQSLDQVAEVNRLLGGTRAILRTLEEIVPPGDDLHILDIGTGSADIPIAIDRWARSRSRTVRITATDLHPQMLEIAAARTRAIAAIHTEPANALDLHYPPASFDIVLLSLTLHHFERADQVSALRAAARIARRAVVVNELERCLPNYIGARLLALTRWRGNRLTRHDGPLSVLRAFTLRELREVGQEAGIRVGSVKRFFFYRLVMVGEGGEEET